MASFREKQWCKKGDLNQVLLNKESMDEVRRMCKVLAPFFAHYDANGDNAIDFEEFRMIFKDGLLGAGQDDLERSKDVGALAAMVDLRAHVMRGGCSRKRFLELAGDFTSWSFRRLARRLDGNLATERLDL
ncbi:unnamed protein product [Durusdinium trenchii]|uniref:EF-hand domain-containing protein n=1 Tax=Durusdinium trenchii TaxID=1381693 RepID=A0ABP0MRG3_9DINO